MTKCPICESAAEEIAAGYLDGKTFRCQKHGVFDVTGPVLNSPGLMKSGSGDWETALKMASAQAIEGSRPRITMYDFHDLPPVESP